MIYRDSGKGTVYNVERLSAVHKDLVKLVHEVARNRSFVVACGYRDETTQKRLFEEKKSKVSWPNSKHNITPSHAIDIYPTVKSEASINWADDKTFYEFGGYVKGVADMLDIRIRWGGDWDMDNDLNDQTFNDLGHFELVV